jgi:hypothetical protein
VLRNIYNEKSWTRVGSDLGLQILVDFHSKWVHKEQEQYVYMRYRKQSTCFSIFRGVAEVIVSLQNGNGRTETSFDRHDEADHVTDHQGTMKLLALPQIIVGLFLLQCSQSHRVISHFLSLQSGGDIQSDAIIARNILLKKIEDSESDEDVFAFAEEVSGKYPFLLRITLFYESYPVLMWHSRLTQMPPKNLDTELIKREICLTALTDTGNTPQRGQRNEDTVC